MPKPCPCHPQHPNPGGGSEASAAEDPSHAVPLGPRLGAVSQPYRLTYKMGFWCFPNFMVVVSVLSWSPLGA